MALSAIINAAFFLTVLKEDFALAECSDQTCLCNSNQHTPIESVAA